MYENENGTGTVPEQAQATDVVQDDAAVEEAVQAAEQQAEAEPAEDSYLNYGNENNYTSAIARAIDNIGNVFTSVPGVGTALKNLCSNIAAFCEEKFGDAAKQTDDAKSAVRDEMTYEIQASEGGRGATTAEIAVTEAVTADPTEFVGDLKLSADAIRNGIDLGDAGDGNLTENLRSAVGQAAAASPYGTANALQVFGDVGAAQIESVYPKGSKEYQAAMDDLAVLNQSMTGAYYEKLLSAERDGAILTDAEREAANNLSLDGVAVKYDEFVPGGDVSTAKSGRALSADKAEHESIVQAGRDLADSVRAEHEQDVLKKSDAIEAEADDTYIAKMEASARMDVIGGTLNDLADADPALGKTNVTNPLATADVEIELKIDDVRTQFRNDTDLGNPDPAGAMGTNYMSLMRGLQAYNDAAVAAIQEQYADNPAGMAEATEGLANVMRNAAGPMFEAMGQDSAEKGCFTAEQVEALDGMSLTGVNVKFSDYQVGMDLKTGEVSLDLDSGYAVDLSEDDAALYGGAYMSDPGAVEPINATAAPSVGSGGNKIPNRIWGERQSGAKSKYDQAKAKFGFAAGDGDRQSGLSTDGTEYGV